MHIGFTRRGTAAIGLLVACVWLPAAAQQAASPLEGWPAWRGPLHTGFAPRADPPTEWSEERNVRWKVPLPGGGHATPVVWGSRIYVLAAVPGDETGEPAPAGPAVGGRGDDERPPRPTRVHHFTVLAYDVATGAEMWSTVVRSEVPHEAGHTTASQASASPVTDGEHLWAFFGSRGLYCLDLDGAVLWSRDFGDARTRNEFGEGASPVLHGDTIVVNWDHEGNSFIAGLDKLTGTERWRRPRDEPTSWATPLVVQDGSRARVVVTGTHRVRSYDLATGEEVWSATGLGRNCAPTPVAADGVVYVMSGHRDPAGMAIRHVGARGDISGSDRIVWRIEDGTSYVPSPLLVDGTLYFLERFKGRLSSYDLLSGEAFYNRRRLPGLGNVYASPVGAGKRIYVLDRDGNALVLRRGRSMKVLARNELDDVFDASPVAVGDSLYLRGHAHLYRIARTRRKGRDPGQRPGTDDPGP